MDAAQTITVFLSITGIISNIVLGVLLYFANQNARLKDDRIKAIENHLEVCDNRHSLTEKQLATFSTLNAVIDVRIDNITKLIEKLEVIVDRLSNDR